MAGSADLGEKRRNIPGGEIVFRSLEAIILIAYNYTATFTNYHPRHHPNLQ